ncbi:helix-turn-helix transcriptional regulator [Chryseobacterium sp.]|uniref:helix-turn-helix domain-containing protein n=1 Tax=Chryseobacterium sp. TaxID=1871047 RepID=UPI0026196632|nr:helix-turn-helix transcriptional regulator [Chryseobacterium sp.]
MNEKEIIHLIKKNLEENKISNYAVAKKMGKSKTTIAKWLTEVTYPDLPDLIRLIEICKLEIKINSIESKP